MRIPLAFQSILVGLAASIVLTALVGLLESEAVTRLLIQPGIAVGTLLAAVLPSAWIYAIEPEGGPEAFLVLIGIGNLLAWWTAFAVLFHICQRLRLRNSGRSVA